MHPIFDRLRRLQFVSQHPSRQLNYLEWDTWRRSPEGLLELIQYPELGVPPQPRLSDRLRADYKWAAKWD